MRDRGALPSRLCQSDSINLNPADLKNAWDVFVQSVRSVSHWPEAEADVFRNRVERLNQLAED